jgi:apolipoprotein N-acyltransferase
MRRTLPPTILFLSGALTAFSFPSTALWPLILVGLVPLLIALDKKKPAVPALAGLFWGFGYFGCLLSWLYRFFRHYGELNPSLSLTLLAILVAYLAIYPAFFAHVAAGWQRQFPALALVLLPCLWVALEWIRGHFLSGFPWGVSGYALTEFLPGIQIASVTGIYGVSYLVILTNVLIAGWITRYSRAEKLIRAGDAWALVLIGVVVAWGWLQLGSGESATGAMRVAVVQANVPQDQKWNSTWARSIAQTHERLTYQAAATGAILVVWPESSSPFPIAIPPSAAGGEIRPNQEYRERLQLLAKRLGIALLFGTVDYRKVGGEIRPVNAAALVRADGSWGETYAKMHLVPFGEYVPLSGLLGFVNRMVQGAIGDFVPGEKPVVVRVDSLRLGTVICYEMIFPELVRRFADSGASLLVNLTNDAWFGTSAGPYQHFQMVRMRAVENRRFVLRAANTGISGIVDPQGRVLVKTPLMEERILQGEVSPRRAKSFYTRYGDVFLILCAILALAAQAAHFKGVFGGGWRPAKHE